MRKLFEFLVVLSGMGLFFVYVDETGYAGKLYKTPEKNKQPFEFGAAFVRADDGTQLAIERQLTVLQHKISKEMKSEEPLKLHATDLYGGSRSYRGISSEKRHAWFEEVLKIGFRPGEVFYDSYLLHPTFDAEVHREGILEDMDLMRSRGVKDSEIKTARKLNEDTTTYERNFLEFLLYCEQRLQRLGHFGILVFDQTEESKKYVPSDIYRYLRAAGLLRHILEAPMFFDAHYHPLLALADFSTFVRQGLRHDNSSGKNRPKLQEWLRDYITPQMLAPFRFLHDRSDIERLSLLTILFGYCQPSINSKPSMLNINALYPVLSRTSKLEKVILEVKRLLTQKSNLQSS